MCVILITWYLKFILVVCSHVLTYLFLITFPLKLIVVVVVVLTGLTAFVQSKEDSNKYVPIIYKFYGVVRHPMPLGQSF